MFMYSVLMKSRLKDVPVTPYKNWKIVGKTNTVKIEQIPLLVKDMIESFFTHK